MARWFAAMALVAAVLPLGCGMPKKAAESALAEVRASYAGIAAQAEVLMPDEARSLRDAIAQAADELTHGDPRRVVTTARTLRARVDEMAERLPEKQLELETTWTHLEASIPGTLDALERRLTRAHRPVAGTPRARFDADRGELSRVAALWDEARTARQAGRLAEAVSKAGDVKYRALRLLDDSQEGS